METSQKPLALHDDLEALMLIERIKQKLEERKQDQKSQISDQDMKNSRYLFS